MKTKILLLISLLAFAGTYCKKGPATGSGTATGNAADGCADLDAMSARMRCEGSAVQFCSSYSKYKWMETQKCPAGKTCFISPDGKSGGCK